MNDAMKWIKLFLYSAGPILLTAALERFLVATGDVQTLSLPEPVIGIPLRYAVLLVGTIELLVALICLFGKQVGLQLGWLAWLATNYVVYRIGLFTMHCHAQATCIGSLADPLHLSRGMTGFIMAFLPVYLLLGSYAAVIWLWLKHGMGRTVELVKMSCPSCGVHIKFAGQYVGRKLHCPQCQTVITLRKPDLLKMACFFCKEHIEFPAHAIGEKIPCPHCKMDITLKEPA
jgi:predicted RNA-binding Zn-ribbon protein involved in translation (DUF1610 family)